MPFDDPMTVAEYDQLPIKARRAIDTLHRSVWPDNHTPTVNGVPETHAPALHAHSFYIQVDGRVLSYVGVVSLTIHQGGQLFQSAGLSCVATDPAVQGQGLGTRTVEAATKWIEQAGFDLGLFTCHPSLAEFYYRAGGWTAAPHVTLAGSEEVGALRSDQLGVAVLMRLFSEKALASAPSLTQATLSLGLPLGQFL